jgi:hypothetical protein
MPKQIKARSGESITSAVPARSKSRARFATICLAVNGARLRLLVDFAGTFIPKNLLMTQGAYVMKGSGSRGEALKKNYCSAIAATLAKPICPRVQLVGAICQRYGEYDK